MRVIRAIVRGILYTPAILVLLVLGLVALVQLPPVQQFIVQRAVNEVNERVDGHFAVDSVGGNFLNTVALYGVAATLDTGVHGTADRLMVRINPFALLGRELHVRWLLLDGVRLFVPELPEGPDEPDEETDDPLGEWRVRLDLLEVRNSRVTVAAGAGEPDRTVDVRELQAGAVWADQRLSVSLDAFSGTLSDPRLTISEASGDFEVDIRDPEPRLRADDVVVAFDQSRFHFSAELGLCEGAPVRLSLQGEPLVPAEFAGDLPGMHHPLRVRAHLAGRWPDAALTFSVAGEAGALQTSGGIHLPFADECEPDWERLSAQVVGAMDSFSPAVFLEEDFDEPTILSAHFSATVHSLGTPARSLDATFEGDESIVQGERVEAFRGHARLGEERGEGEIRLVARDTEVFARGWADFRTESFSGTAEVQGLNLAAWIGEPWNSDLNAALEVTGTGFSPERLSGVGVLSMEDSFFGPLEVSRLQVPFDLDEERLVFDEATLASNLVDVRARGTMPLALEEEGEVSLIARFLELEAFVPFLDTLEPEDLGGSAFLRVDAAGRLDSVSGDFTFRGVDLRVPQVQAAQLGLDGEFFRMDALENTGEIYLYGTSEDILVAEEPITQMEAAFSVAFLEQQRRGTFFVSAEYQGEESRIVGRLEEEDDSFRAFINQLRVTLAGQRWRNVDVASLSYDGTHLEVNGFDLRAEEDQRIRIDGRLDPVGEQDLSVRIHRFQLAPYGPLLGRDDPFGGQLDAVLSLTGSPDRPEMMGTVALTQGRFGTFALDTATAQVAYAERWLDLDLRLVEPARAGLLRGEFQIPVDLNLVPVEERFDDYRPLTGRVRADEISLSMIEAFAPQVQVTAGVASVDVHVSGTVPAPEFGGTVEVADGIVQIDELDVPYRNIRGVLRFERDLVIVDEFFMQGGDGQLGLAGNMELDDWSPGALDFALSARRFTAMDSALATAVVSSELTLVGILEQPRLRGRVDVDELIVRPPTEDQRELEPLEFTMPGLTYVGVEEPDDVGPPAEVPMLERADVDLTVRIPRNAWVRSEEIDLEWAGDIRAFKATDEENIRLVGSIEILRGFIRIYGRRLSVDEGQVTFTGARDIMPLLDLTFIYETPEFTILARITGTPENPAIALESEPPLEEADILAVLLFGRPFDQLGEGEQSAMRDRIGGVLGGLAAQQLRGTLGDRLPIDTVEVEPGVDPDEAIGFGVGKYLREDIFLQYVQRFGSEAETILRLEYFLTRRWVVTTSASTAGRSSVDVFWQLRF